MLAAGLGGVVAYWFFVPPNWSTASFRLEQFVSLILYGTSSVVIIWAAQSYRGLLERLRSEEATRQLLNLELVHRIKNILAGVQGIIGQALRNQEDLLETVSGRLAALGATNNLLINSEWQSAPLREILLQEIAPYGPMRVQLLGDDVECPYELAVLLALMIHELTTNAVKYGALSSPYGQVAVAWSLVSGRLTLEWTESGGPKPSPPTREGFGTKLLRSGVRQLHGSVDRRFEASGLQCRIELTMPQKQKRKAVEVFAFQKQRLDAAGVSTRRLLKSHQNNLLDLSPPTPSYPDAWAITAIGIGAVRIRTVGIGPVRIWPVGISIGCVGI